MNFYRKLNKQEFRIGEYGLAPLRYQDRFEIMKWRNEQIFHLRQNKPLTEEDQENYFQHVISKLFDSESPNQILFSYLLGDKCLGYGGLVHINWVDQNAELSFLMDTELEKNQFEFHYTNYLQLIQEVAFSELNLHKIYTYAFDVRPYLYPVLEKNGFHLDARLKEHTYFDGEYKDVLIHSIINSIDNK